MPQIGGPLIGAHTGFNPFGSLLNQETMKHVHRVSRQVAKAIGNDPLETDLRKMYYQTTRGRREKFYQRHGDPDGNKNIVNDHSKTMAPRRPNRANRKAKQRSRKGTKIQRYIPLGIPKQKVVRFKLVSPMLPAAGASTVAAYYVCKANSLNDPTGSAGAGLPHTLDQWAAFYSKYMVIGSKIKLKIHSVSQTGGAVVGITLANNGDTQTAYDAYMEMPHTRSRLLSSDVDVATLTNNFSAKKYFKYRNIKEHDALHGTFSTTPGDPTEQADYVVWYQDANKTENVTLEGIIEMEFICLLFDPITAARSSL